MRILPVLLCLFLTVPAWAGPFGTEMGDSPDKFADLKKLEQYEGMSLYRAFNLPQKHSSFTSYILAFGDDGLAMIMASTKDYEDDHYGNTAKSEYNNVKEQLTKKYGRPVSVERLNTGSIWNEPRYFATSINKNERRHKSLWFDNLPDNLESVELEVRATNSGVTYLQLHYLYKNMVKAREKAKAANEGAL